MLTDSLRRQTQRLALCTHLSLHSVHSLEEALLLAFHPLSRWETWNSARHVGSNEVEIQAAWVVPVGSILGCWCGEVGECNWSVNSEIWGRFSIVY